MHLLLCTILHFSSSTFLIAGQLTSLLYATSSMDESAESSSLSEGDSSRPSESENFEESKGVKLQQEFEISQSQEEQLLNRGSKISKIMSFVLIVSFVLKDNLSKAAWADLL